ncbi:hypothetical protein ACFYMO_30865 [Streptomyces sp. NPDC007025]|uniref:hypothetical protein n=1 Tax=Streptomyces sp. NPDC007025 TaxID=3364771 RepID=UPI0036BB8372
MSRYALQYAPPADEARRSMPPALRASFDVGMRDLSAAPYGLGSAPVKDDPDRREATISDVVVRYYVSTAVLTVTVVRVIYF